MSNTIKAKRIGGTRSATDNEIEEPTRDSDTVDMLDEPIDKFLERLAGKFGPGYVQPPAAQRRTTNAPPA